MAQAAHAALDLAIGWPEATTRWRMASNNVVVLAVPGGVEELGQECNRLHRAGCVLAAFTDPDVPGHLTAAAIVPHGDYRSLVGHLPLAGRQNRAMSTKGCPGCGLTDGMHANGCGELPENWRWDLDDVLTEEPRIEGAELRGGVVDEMEGWRPVE